MTCRRQGIFEAQIFEPLEPRVWDEFRCSDALQQRRRLVDVMRVASLDETIAVQENFVGSIVVGAGDLLACAPRHTIGALVPSTGFVSSALQQKETTLRAGLSLT